MQTCEEWFTPLYCDPSKLKEWYQMHMHQIVQRTSSNEFVASPDHNEDEKQVRAVPPTQDITLPLILHVPQPLIIPAVPTNQPPIHSLHSTTKRKREPLASVPEDEEELSKEDVAIRINNIHKQDAMWWFGSMHHTHLISCQKNTLPLHNNISKTKRAMFNKRTVRGFRNFFYLQKLPDGTAVGNETICTRIIRSQKQIPPLLDKKAHTTEEECRSHVRKIFTKIWFVTYYESKINDDDDEEELVCWPDLCATNVASFAHLKELVLQLFRDLSRENQRLKKFLELTFQRLNG